MSSDHEVDWLAITECFGRHRVAYLIVGGVGAQLHGAVRPTNDFDSLPDVSEDNLDRLAAALRELGAFLRVDGLTDDEARGLPVRIDRATLTRMDISTWRTTAGDLDVLTAIPTRDGGRARYEDLVSRASSVDFGGVPVRVAALDDIIASKEQANRPKDLAALDELQRLAADRDA